MCKSVNNRDQINLEPIQKNDNNYMNFNIRTMKINKKKQMRISALSNHTTPSPRSWVTTTDTVSIVSRAP